MRKNSVTPILFCFILFLAGCVVSEPSRIHNARKSWSLNTDKQKPRYGDSCERFELRYGDYWHYSTSFRGKDKSHRTEKRMLHQAIQGKEYWYGFSMMVPIESSNPKSGTKVGQWHNGDLHGFSPAADQQLNGEKLLIRIAWDTEEVKQFKKGKWFDFVYQFKFGVDGFAKVWIDGVKFMEFSGNIGTPKSRPYFKYGIYNPNFLNKNDIIIVYFDEYRRGNSYEDVDPSHGTGQLDRIFN